MRPNQRRTGFWAVAAMTADACLTVLMMGAVSIVAMARTAKAIGYPLLVKAVSGGGGKGMRTVTDPAELTNAVRAARTKKTKFGNNVPAWFAASLRPLGGRPSKFRGGPKDRSGIS